MNIDRPNRTLRMPWQKRKDDQPHPKESTVARRLTVLNFLPKAIKGHIVACAGEFVGTFLFLLFAFGGTNTVNTAPAEGANAIDLAANPAKLLYIALCFGFSLAVNAWVFFRISGGLFNPAVTIGMMLIGATGYIRGALIIVAQLLGAISAAALVSAMFPGPLNVRTTLGGGTSVVQGLFIEMFLTAQLVFTIFMLAAEKHSSTFIAPIGIGLSLFIAELMGVYYTGGSLNPARTLGPCVVVHAFSSYHWIYWIGPILGAMLAAAFWYFVKALEYETVNTEPTETDIVGKRFDPNSGKEKLITRGGVEVEISPDLDGRTLANNNTASASKLTPESEKLGPEHHAGHHYDGGHTASQQADVRRIAGQQYDAQRNGVQQHDVQRIAEQQYEAQRNEGQQHGTHHVAGQQYDVERDAGQPHDIASYHHGTTRRNNV